MKGLSNQIKAKKVSVSQADGTKYYYFAKEPMENWEPYRTEEMYDGLPDLGTYMSSVGCRTPIKGEYLAIPRDGAPYVVGCYDVKFRAMPPVSRLIELGIIMEVSHQIMELDLKLHHQMYETASRLLRCEGIMDDLEWYLKHPDDPACAFSLEELKKELEVHKQEYAQLSLRFNELKAQYQTTVAAHLPVPEYEDGE